MVTPVGQQLRRLTTVFIDRQPVDVELERALLLDDGEGGRSTSRATLPPQTVTLCEPPSSGYGAPQSTAEGTSTQVDFLLVAQWDADIEPRDEFVLDTLRYRLDKVLPANGWERRAYVVKVGRA